MSDEEQDIFVAVAALLGAKRDERPSANHIKAFHFGEGQPEFYFFTDWRNSAKGGIRATTPHAWGNSFTGHGAPEIGFSLNRTPEALAKDIRRRWLDKANTWHRKTVAAKDASDRKETERRLRVEALLGANGCELSHDEARLPYDGKYVGHGITFDRLDLSPSSYHGFRVQVEVQSEGALRMIAGIAGEDYRMHCKSNSASAL